MSRQTPEIPSRLRHRFRKISYIKHGTFGSVFKVEDKNGNTFAIKCQRYKCSGA